MGKRIHWILLVVISALSLGTMIYFGMQPRPESRINLSQFKNPEDAASILFSELHNEIQQNPMLLLGVEGARPEHFTLIKEFLTQNAQTDSAYNLIVIDSSFGNSNIPDAIKVSTRDEFDAFVEGTEKALAAGKRVAVIVPTTFAAQVIPLNLAEIYKQRTGRIPMSLSVTDFPRNRAAEKSMLHPCIVGAVDQSGLGPFGCLIVTLARANYRKSFANGELVGILNQTGPKDFLFLYTNEP